MESSPLLHHFLLPQLSVPLLQHSSVRNCTAVSSLPYGYALIPPPTRSCKVGRNYRYRRNPLPSSRLLSRLHLAIKRCKRIMLSSTTAFLPLPCNICRASKYPEFANLDSAGSIKNGRELVITFLLHLQSQSIFHMIFNYWFCSLCLFGQRRINPGIYRKMKG